MTFETSEYRDVQAQADIGIWRPFILAELEVISHGDHVVGERRRQSRQIGRLVHLHGRGKLVRLDLKLAKGGIIIKGRIIVVVNIPEHLGRIVAQSPGHIDIPGKVNSHHGLELPESKHHRAFRVVDIRDGPSHHRLCPSIFKLRGFLRLVASLGLDEILHGVLVDFLVDIERFLGEKDGIVCLLHLGNHIQS